MEMAPCHFNRSIRFNHLICRQHMLMLKNLLCKGRKLAIPFDLPLLKRSDQCIELILFVQPPPAEGLEIMQSAIILI